MLCISSIIVILVLLCSNTQSSSEENELQTLTLWQIDSFEGGTGSRAAYLQEKGNDYKKLGFEYVNVVTLSAEAAKMNIENGNLPDIISFGASDCGLENSINSEYKINCWCYGSYCLLSVGESADFSDASIENTIINGGKNNLVQAAALTCGLEGADMQSSTYAYVDLVNGKYKYLLGTQRDIYRLNARKISYSVKPITQFNDLYQLIAVCSKDYERAEASYNYIKYLMENNSDVYKLGMLGGTCGNNEKIAPLENLNYEITLSNPISQAARGEIEQVIELKDINKLKTLLK